MITKHLDGFCVRPTESLRTVLRIMNNQAIRTVLVTDIDRELKGIITDGDIRRGLLQNIGLDSEVSSVMTSNPITAKEGSSKEGLADIMDKEGILSIPVLNEGQKVIGLETLQEILRKPKFDNPVFLMAGGFGTRLRPLTDNCPKPMLQIGNKPILETVSEKLCESGV